jgi:hypothetical protein
MKYIEKLRDHYHKLNRKSKQKALDSAVKILGYNRKYLISILNNFEPKDEYKIKGRGRKSKYNYIKPIILDLWELFGGTWSKRLKVIIVENIGWIIKKYNLNNYQIKLITGISPSSIDRVVKGHRINNKKRIYCQTRPGSLLRRQIPIIIELADDINKPGHIQIDLIAHCGNSLGGVFLWTLNATDIYSQWTESYCILNKSEDEVINALNDIFKRLPFNVLSINSDNGSEFINWELLRFCRTNNIQFTRTRPYKKDDNAYIEQKNWSNVRRVIGWDRYEGIKSQRLLNKLYFENLRIFFNLIMPSTKLVEVEKIGSRYKRRYDIPKTPLTRLYNYDKTNPKITSYLKLKQEINPFELIHHMNTRLDEIWETRSKRVIMDKNYLHTQENLKEIDKLLKKEEIYG